MLYKDQNLIQVIKKENEMERADVIKDPKSELNILLEISGKNYEVRNGIIISSNQRSYGIANILSIVFLISYRNLSSKSQKKIYEISGLSHLKAASIVFASVQT